MSILDVSAFTTPIFDTPVPAALHAGKIFVVMEFFGWSVPGVTILETGCFGFRPAVSVISRNAYCNELVVLTSAVNDHLSSTHAGHVLSEAGPCACNHFEGREHGLAPDAAARRLVKAILSSRLELVKLIAQPLLGMSPVGRDRLLQGWARRTVHDPAEALIQAADSDLPCEYPLSEDDFCC